MKIEKEVDIDVKTSVVNGVKLISIIDVMNIISFYRSEAKTTESVMMMSDINDGFAKLLSNK